MFIHSVNKIKSKFLFFSFNALEMYVEVCDFKA